MKELTDKEKIERFERFQKTAKAASYRQNKLRLKAMHWIREHRPDVYDQLKKEVWNEPEKAA